MHPIIRAMMNRVGGVAGAGSMLALTPGEGGDIQRTQRNGQQWPWTPQGRINDGFSQFPEGPQQQGAQGPAPIDRIKAAFDAMRSRQQPNVMDANGPARPDANGVYGADATMMPQQGAPGQPMNLASHGVVNVPDLPRPAPQEDPQQQPMGFFMRNAMMQKDPNGGGYLDPAKAAQASQSLPENPFARLFS